MSTLARRAAARWPVLSGMREAIGMGLSALVAYKMRAGLTILGVVMGIMTVTGMSAIVAGLNKSMATQIEGFGTAVIFVRPFGPGENLSTEERRRRKGLSELEVEALTERCQTCSAVAPLEFPAAQNIKYGREKVQNAQLIGTTPAYEIVHDAFIDRGRFLAPSDVSRGSKVAVIGSEIAETLFPYVDPVDKEITLDGIRFRVIGVMEHKGKFLNFNRDNLILIPMGSMVRASFFNFLLADVKSTSPMLMERTTEEIREILRRQRKLKFAQKDTFMMFTQDTLTNLYNQLTGGIYLVMIAISSIGLVVGGVGVMNIMLVTVTERTREIGVRKALGARKRDIRWQFLTEAMTLTGVGGVLGIAIGGGVAALVDKFSPFPAVLQPTWVVIAFVTSVVTGLTFGLWPAVKAARLDPTEALRYECRRIEEGPGLATEPLPPPLAPPATGEPPLGFLARLFGLYFAPIATFRSIAAHPTFVAPLLAIVLVNSAFTFVWLRKADHVELSRGQLEEEGIFDRYPPEQHAAIVERQVRLLPIFAWLNPIVLLPIMIVALAGLFLFVYRFFYASETTFPQSLAVMTWAHLAFYLLATLLVVLVLSLKGEWSVDPRTVIQANPAALVEKSAVPKPVHAFLDALDLFSAWLLFLLAAGYAATARRSVGSAAVGVLVLWGIYVFLKMAMATVF